MAKKNVKEKPVDRKRTGRPVFRSPDLEGPKAVVDDLPKERTDGKPSLYDQLTAIRKAVDEAAFDAIPETNWGNLELVQIPSAAVALDSGVLLFLLRWMVAYIDLGQPQPPSLMVEVRRAIARYDNPEMGGKAK